MMAGSFMSTLMMFFPQQTQWVCIIGLCIFVFGIYIPYEEYKKKKKQRQKNLPKKQEMEKHVSLRPADGQKQLEQLDTLKKAGLLSEEEYREKKRKM